MGERPSVKITNHSPTQGGAWPRAEVEGLLGLWTTLARTQRTIK